MYRTLYCNDICDEHIGQTVQLAGWVDVVRDHGGVIFVDIRDYTGVTQVVIHDENLVKNVNRETVISVSGIVEKRDPDTVNEKIATGYVELVANSLQILGKSKNMLPFDVRASRQSKDEVRLKYRYLDLRNPKNHENLVIRSKIIRHLRNKMEEKNFLDMQTPILTASSPEGARDFLVPSRKHPGKFYALPQAPQQFKQLLMVSGFDRYFQVAPCFRDEDARADRSPGEFYQLDMEMAFASQEDVFAVIEKVLPPIFAKYGVYKTASAAPFKRISFLDALEKYGSDKPDLRIDLELTDATEVMADCGFGPFEGNVVKAIVVSDFVGTRKVIDKMCADVEMQANNKAFWFRVDENGEFVGGISKFLVERKEQVIAALGLKPGDFVGLTAGKKLVAQKTAGVFRKILGNTVEGHMKKDCYEFCWIVDFPMYEMGEESGELEFCHNPFSMPQGGMKDLLEKDPLDILAYQYDLVCNGVELSSGAVRNHDPEIMIKAFELVRLGEDDVKAKFPAMYNAFTYGAPPHAGIAPGVDRMVMLIAGEESIREIIPFPMNKTAMDVMMGAPSEVDPKQLADVHIKIDLPGEEK